MSYWELSMIDVKGLLRRWQAGHSTRQMHREGVAEVLPLTSGRPRISTAAASGGSSGRGPERRES
jgi:hypothetical protein